MPFILLLALALAFCSFGFQTLIAFAVYATTGGQLLPWLLVLACFLLGLGLGSLRASKLSPEKLRSRLVPTELLIGIIGGLSVILIFGFDGLAKITPLGSDAFGYPRLHEFLIILWSVSFGGAVGYLSGFELPIVLSAFDKNILGHKTHWVIGAHYFGTLVAALVVQGLMLPRFDALVSAQILGMFNSTIALVTLWALRGQGLRMKTYLAAGVAGILILFLVGRATPEFYQTYLRINYFRPTITAFDSGLIENSREIIRRAPKVERIRTVFQYMDIISLPSIKSPGTLDTMLYLDTHLQFGSAEEKIYHEIMAHFPMAAFNIKPRHVLVAGGGDGLLVRELLKYPDIESIDLVELDPMMLEFSLFDRRFSELNQGSLRNKKVNVRNEDAFTFMRNGRNDEKYDLILIDFPFPHNPDLARLFSREFYRVAFHRLKDNGFIALDFPLELKDAKKGGRNDIIFNTLKSAGFTDFLPFSGYDSFIAARAAKGETSKVVSPFISTDTLKASKDRLDILEHINWSDSYVNSVFKPKSFGRGFE